MKFDPFIASALLRSRPGLVHFGKPVQLSLVPDYQPSLSFALRLHRATRLHYDLRFAISGTLFSLVLHEAPSLDPGQRVAAKLVADHHPKFIANEWRIPGGRPGAGPTMPVDLGRLIPIDDKEETYESAALRQIGEGDFRFLLDGRRLQGGWCLLRRGGIHWDLSKLEDRYASTTEVLVLDRSIKTGRTLDEI